MKSFYKKTTYTSIASLVVFILNLLTLGNCRHNKSNASQKENKNVNKCAILFTESSFSKLTVEDLPYWIPSVEDAEESYFILEELKNRLGESNYTILRSPQVLFSKIIVTGDIDINVIEQFCCFLKDIKEQNKTKPIVLEIYTEQFVKKKDSEGNEFDSRELASVWVIE